MTSSPPLPRSSAPPLPRPAAPLRILVADDHEVVRRGIRAILEVQPGWEIVSETANGREAVEQAKKLQPDVAVLDITMPELNGLDATRQILQALPAVEVLILTMHESEQVLREVIHAGARGYVLKSNAGSDLVVAVQSLALHRPFFPTTLSNTVLHKFIKGARPENTDTPARRPLSPREREIVQLLAEGKSSPAIAEILGISAKTVSAHRANIKLKLGFESISDLVRYAIRNKMIRP